MRKAGSPCRNCCCNVCVIVRNRATGEPIAGATVRLFDRDAADPGATVASGTTDDAGKWCAPSRNAAHRYGLDIAIPSSYGPDGQSPGDPYHPTRLKFGSRLSRHRRVRPSTSLACCTQSGRPPIGD